jgi:hypothetical protein
MIMKDFFLKNRLVIVFIIAGAVAGFLYWKYIGCLSGTCKIKSIWYMSTIYGALLGYITGDILRNLIQWAKRRKERENPE